jgi:hypothetical protein
MAPKANYHLVGASVATITARIRDDLESIRLAVVTSHATMADARETIRNADAVLARDPIKISN